jgi:DNA-binding MarR family transcriptional regulator
LSTLFTTEVDQLKNPTPLTLLLQSCERRVMEGLLTRLRPDFPEISAAHLTLFGALDCGVTHASAVAARLGVSRQAVARTARELDALGYLRLEEDPGQRNRHRLTMTDAGMRLAIAGRAALAEIEAELEARIGGADLAALRAALERDWTTVDPLPRANRLQPAG